MLFHALALSVLMISGQALAQGRGPAVEDFVGIEVEEHEGLAPGSDALFNLEHDMNKLETVKAREYSVKKIQTLEPKATGWSLTSIFGISFLLGLPLLSWIMAMHHLRKKATVENASNIAVLEQYRRERERSKKKDDQEQIRKVS